MRKTLWLSALSLLLVPAAPGQKHDLKVYVSADMEGIGGVSTWAVQAGPKGREYEKFRRIMTEEVNAAIAGAYDAGATEVVVSDSHGTGDAQNIDVELLDKRARLIRAWPRPLQMMQGIDGTFGAVVFIGYHAREGQPNASLAHTFTGRMEIKLNGVDASEGTFNAAIAGEFDVPVVFLAGDLAACEEIKQVLGQMETVTIKHASGYYSAMMKQPEEIQFLIRSGVEQGIARRAEVKPYKVAKPVKMEMRFFDTVDAETLSYLPGFERPSGDLIIFNAHDMIEASKFLTAYQFLNFIH